MQNKHDIPFSQALQKLPNPLRSKFYKYCAIAAFAAALSLSLAIYLKVWQYLIGILFSLFFLYQGLDLMWAYTEGRLRKRKMICIQASHILEKHRLYLILRDLETEDPNSATQKIYLHVLKKDAAFFKAGIILDAYFWKGNDFELVAWEIIDYATRNENI